MKPKDYIIEMDEPKNVPILSVVITSRAEAWPTLLMTLQGIQEDCLKLEEAYRKGCWECIVVFNSLLSESQAAENKFKICNLRRFGNFRYVKMDRVSMGLSRNAGVYVAAGKYGYIGDSHMTFSRDFFHNLLTTYENIKWKDCLIPRKIGILHSSLGWMSGIHQHDILNAYKAEIKKWFWGSWYKSPDTKPFQIPMMGTSFLFEREFFIEMGGYNENFKAYGGDEAYINLKAWRMGYTVWVDPNTYVWHLADNRGYSWTNDDLWFNTLLAAYTIGGKKWLENQVTNYKTYLMENHTDSALAMYINNLAQMQVEVIKSGRADHAWIESKAVKTLDELMIEYGWA